jgi:hypothetical protein
MENENSINTGDLVKVKKPFIAKERFCFNINDEYDFGMVIKKSEFSHKNEGYYVTVLLNSSNIVYRHLDEVYKI